MAQAQAYATYLVELAMLDYSMLCYTYSMVAAGAVVAANRLLGRADDCPAALQKHCGYARDELLPCARDLAQLHSKSGPLPPALLRCPTPSAPCEAYLRGWMQALQQSGKINMQAYCGYAYNQLVPPVQLHSASACCLCRSIALEVL